MFNEERQRLLEELKKKSRSSVLIIEGKKDKAKLESLNIHAEFFLLCKQNRSIPESAEKISEKYKEAILMLDQDKQGKKMEKMFIQYLQKFGVKVNNRIGKRLLYLANSSTVEGI